jgi:hypothetical protein
MLSTKPCRHTDKKLAGQYILGYAEEEGAKTRKQWVWCMCACGTQTAKRMDKLVKTAEEKKKSWCSSKCPVLVAKREKQASAAKAKIEREKREVPSDKRSRFYWQNCHWCGEVPKAYRKSIPAQMRWGWGWTAANTIAECHDCNTMRGKQVGHQFLDKLRAILVRHGEASLPTKRFRPSAATMREMGRRVASTALPSLPDASTASGEGSRAEPDTEGTTPPALTVKDWHGLKGLKGITRKGNKIGRPKKERPPEAERLGDRTS